MAVYIGDLKKTLTREKKFDENGATNLHISLETILFEMVWTYIKTLVFWNLDSAANMKPLLAKRFVLFLRWNLIKSYVWVYVDLFVQPIAEQFTIFRTKFTNEYEA